MANPPKYTFHIAGEPNAMASLLIHILAIDTALAKVNNGQANLPNLPLQYVEWAVTSIFRRRISVIHDKIATTDCG